MKMDKGPSKIVNIFPYKQNSWNCLTPPSPQPVMIVRNNFGFGHFCMWNQVQYTNFSYLHLMIVKN